MYLDTRFVAFIDFTTTQIFSMNPVVDSVGIYLIFCVDNSNSIRNRWLFIIFHCDIVEVTIEFDAFLTVKAFVSYTIFIISLYIPLLAIS